MNFSARLFSVTIRTTFAGIPPATVASILDLFVSVSLGRVPGGKVPSRVPDLPMD